MGRVAEEDALLERVAVPPRERQPVGKAARSRRVVAADVGDDAEEVEGARRRGRGRRVGGPPRERASRAPPRDSRITGRVNKALQVSEILSPFLPWARECIDERLNGILVNWYDPDLGHYIGRHRDSTRGVLHGSPIVTVSFGGERDSSTPASLVEGRMLDFKAEDSAAFVMPWQTNTTYTHEVPPMKGVSSRRISVTLRICLNLTALRPSI